MKIYPCTITTKQYFDYFDKKLSSIMKSQKYQFDE